MQYDKEIEFAKNIARKAGEKIMEVYSRDFSFSEKENDQGPVTEADIASDHLICVEIKKVFPKDGILSEETYDDLSRLEKKRVWIVDPLDGTKDFLMKNGEFSVHIGLSENGAPVLGVVFLPAFNLMYYGAKGMGAFIEAGGEKRKLIVRRCSDLSEMIMVGSRSHRTGIYEGLVKELRPLREIVHGSVGAKAGIIASGKADYMFYPGDKTKEWDICAPHAIIVEAGGEATGLTGEQLEYNKNNFSNPDGILISNGENHDGIVKKIREILLG